MMYRNTRNPKSDSQPVAGVHQADRDHQIGHENTAEAARSARFIRCF